MNLPSMVEYQSAVQSPALAFTDADLKHGKVESNSFGIPIARSGGFAITYKILSPKSHWAVRLFHRYSPNLESQYSHLARYFNTITIQRFLDFDYQPQGVLVQGQRHPLVKMEWSESPTLQRWLESNYSESKKVKKLSEQFSTAIRELEQLGVAHGDLQHGNMLVGNDITFIDYDGMFVPGMTLDQSAEIGHRNYQSQLRTAQDVGPHIDRFSSYVISLSLEAIAHRPEFYENFCSGENLLFTARDYVDPSTSEIFSRMKSIPSLRNRVENLEHACLTPLRDLPSLDSFNGSDSGLTKSRASEIITTPMLHQHEVVSAGEHYELTKRLGSVVTVVGKVTEVTELKLARNRQPYRFVNFGASKSNSFYAPVWREALDALDNTGRQPSEYKDKWVSINGILESYNGRPQIQITDIASIRILEGAAEAQQMLSEWNAQVEGVKNRKSSARAKLPTQPATLTPVVGQPQGVSNLTHTGVSNNQGSVPPTTKPSSARSKLPPLPETNTPTNVTSTVSVHSRSVSTPIGKSRIDSGGGTSNPLGPSSQASPAARPYLAVSAPKSIRERSGPFSAPTQNQTYTTKSTSNQSSTSDSESGKLGTSNPLGPNWLPSPAARPYLAVSPPKSEPEGSGQLSASAQNPTYTTKSTSSQSTTSDSESSILGCVFLAIIAVGIIWFYFL